jgi:hypothetical protein
LAAATALSTSPTVQQGTSAITSPVLEFVTGMYFFVADSFHSLFTQYLERFVSIKNDPPSLPFDTFSDVFILSANPATPD